MRIKDAHDMAVCAGPIAIARNLATFLSLAGAVPPQMVRPSSPLFFQPGQIGFERRHPLVSLPIARSIARQPGLSMRRTTYPFPGFVRAF